jgi:hypothetical protein
MLVKTPVTGKRGKQTQVNSKYTSPVKNQILSPMMMASTSPGRTLTFSPPLYEDLSSAKKDY